MIVPNQFYHIYNRGNNGQKIFFNRGNYLYFLKKIRVYFLDHIEIIAYCLMPNHFHLLVFTKEDIQQKKFSNDLMIMLRSYARGINKQENRSGSLFQQHTKIKPLFFGMKSISLNVRSKMSLLDKDVYPFVCFHYIHQNPVKGKLVKSMEDWEMSSYRDYIGLRNGTLCNKQLAYSLLDVPLIPEIFKKESLMVIFE
jgi:putative transposase